MKRDMDLIRNILLFIEEKADVPPKTVKADDLLDLNDNPAIIAMHLELLRDGGFIEIRQMPNKQYEVLRITLAGYEYLDNIRNAKIWRNVRDKIGVLGGASFEIIKAVAIAEVKNTLGI
jgi:hypothetical protein